MVLSDPMSEVHDLMKRYGSAVTVDPISFEVRAGEAPGFSCPNGVGKSDDHDGDIRARRLQDEGTYVNAGRDGDLIVSGMDARDAGTVAGTAGITLCELTPRNGSLEEAQLELTPDAAEYHAGGDLGALTTEQLHDRLPRSDLQPPQ